MDVLRICARLMLPAAVLLWCGLVWCGFSRLAAAEPDADLAVDDVMESDPYLWAPEPILTFLPGTKELWIESLKQAEADLQRQLAESIAKAHRLGAPGMADAVPALVKLLERDDVHPAVTYAVVSALSTLDADQTAGLLFEQAQASGGGIAQITEPALARWKHEPAYQMWRERLVTSSAERRALRLAIRCLGEVRDASSVSALADLVDRRDAEVAVRVEAAQSLASIRRSGLEAHAKRLAADKSPAAILDRLLAAMLLQHHSGQQAETQLSELAVDSEPSVAALALSRLVDIAPEQVFPLAGQLITNADAKVRRIASQALVEVPSPGTVALLGSLLDDPHPGNRRYVCRSLFRLAGQDELTEAVIDAGVQALSGESWRGLEQSTLLLTFLDHKQVAGRFVELLEHQRGEVVVTAAWGLRKLAVAETLPAMLQKATRDYEAASGVFPSGGPSREHIDHQVAQLFEAFGELRYVPAEELMRKHIPKHAGVGNVSRRAAIWSIGYLHENEPDDELTRAFVGRLNDMNPFDPEDDGVRRYSAVSLGRMLAKSTVSELEKHLNDTSEIGLAARWSYERMTGETLAPLEAGEGFYNSWALIPLQ